MLFQCILVLVASSWLVEAQSDRSRLIIFTPELIERQGYPAETHHVVTEDGYLLEMHRIPFGRDGPTTGNRPPVFVMHGFCGASSNFVALGSEDSIAFNLADAGYDVWMGNARGTRDSRRHVTLDPDGVVDRFKFWDFSWEEIGMYDVPAMTDYVRENTGFAKIHYIGHSQGGTVFFVMNSMRPEYNNRFASAQLLAPAGFKNHFPSPVIGATSIFTDTIYQAAVNRGFLELGWNLLNIIRRRDNNDELPNSDMLSTIIKEFEDSQSGRSIFTIPSFFGGAALKQLAHFGQCVRSNNFQRWDYGIIRNLEVYGTLRPPRYDLSRVTVQSTLHYTIADTLVGYQDIIDMAEVLPNAVTRRIEKDNFQHSGFIFDRNVRGLVTEYIIEQLKTTEIN